MSSTTPSQKPRVEYLDTAKGLCIIIVVIHHLEGVYAAHVPCSFVLYSFFMPLFFFLSGIFFKTYNGFEGFFLRKTNQLAIPFFFWLFINALLLPIIDPYMGCWHLLSLREVVANISQIPTHLFTENYYCNSVWFLWCLFLTTLLFYPIKKISEKLKRGNLFLFATSLFVGIMGVVMGQFNIRVPFFIDTAMTVFPFFVLGNLSKDKIVSQPECFRRKWVLLLGAVAAFSISYLVLSSSILGGGVDFRGNGFRGMAWLTIYPVAMLGILGTLFVSKIMEKVPVFPYFGRYSLIILVTHRYVFQTIGYFLGLLGLSGNVAFGVNLLLTLVTFFALIPLIRKVLPHVTAQKDVFKVK